jgi:hypothetical protein
VPALIAKATPLRHQMDCVELSARFYNVPNKPAAPPVCLHNEPGLAFSRICGGELVGLRAADDLDLGSSAILRTTSAAGGAVWCPIAS